MASKGGYFSIIVKVNDGIMNKNDIINHFKDKMTNNKFCKQIRRVDDDYWDIKRLMEGYSDDDRFIIVSRSYFDHFGQKYDKVMVNNKLHDVILCSSHVFWNYYDCKVYLKDCNWDKKRMIERLGKDIAETKEFIADKEKQIESEDDDKFRLYHLKFKKFLENQLADYEKCLIIMKGEN